MGDRGWGSIAEHVSKMLTFGLSTVRHGSSWDSDVDMDTVCLSELDVCGSSGGGTVSLPSQPEKHLTLCNMFLMQTRLLPFAAFFPA